MDARTVLLVVELCGLACLVAVPRGWARRAWGRLARVVRPPVPVTDRPPIERVAADLRRLRARLADEDDPTRSALKRRTTRLAYEDRLVDACRALEVDCRIRALTGPARRAETMRVEAALAAAGLEVAPQPH